jgi:hypothetical protein
MGRTKLYNQVQNQKQAPAIYEDMFVNRPPAGFTGRLFVSTDTKELYRDTGIAYDLIGGPGAGTVTGSGTAGKLVKFTAATVIGNSIMTEVGTAITVAGSLTATAFITNAGLPTQFVKGDGSLDGNTYLTSPINLATQVTGILPILNGGTASATKNFVDLTTVQNVNGQKSFIDPTRVGTGSNADGDFTIGNGIAATNGRLMILGVGSSDFGIYFTAYAGLVSNTASAYLAFLANGSTLAAEAGRFSVGRRFLVGITTDDGANIAQFNGSITTLGNTITGKTEALGDNSTKMASTAFIKGQGYLTSATGVTSITGTANQVNASSPTGAVTLSLPQSISTANSPQFAGLTLTGGLFGTSADLTGKITLGVIAALNGIINSVESLFLNSDSTATGSNAAIVIGTGRNGFGGGTEFGRFNVTGLVVPLNVSAKRFVGNNAADNTVDVVQSGGGSMLSNLYRAEAKFQNTSTTIDATATEWNDSTNGSTVTYTLPNGGNTQGGIFMFVKTGTGTLTLSGTIITNAGVSVGSLAVTSVSGMKLFYTNGSAWFQLV